MIKKALYKKSGLLAIIIILIASYFIFDLKQYISSDFLSKIHQQHPYETFFLYFIATVLVTALSLPIASVMTLAAGFLFNFWVGLILISFASTIGATLACIVSRTLLQEWVQHKFTSQAERFNRGVDRDGGFFLFSLRLIPVVPFFVINLVMGLTKMPIWRFYWISQLGMLAGTAVYINTGAQLSKIESFSIKGVLTPGIITAFVLLGIFPWIARKFMQWTQIRKVYKPWTKPESFDYNLIVIGAGAAGLVSSYIASAVKAKVCLVEKNKMGGDCLNTGCVPSKALIRSAKIKKYLERASEFGLLDVKAQVSFTSVMERIASVITQVEPHDSVERYTSLGVDCKSGTATIISPWEVAVDGERFTTKSIVVASGARPLMPPFPGLDKVKWFNSDTIWSLREQPANMLVLGGGPIGCELAQAFNRLGSKVTLVDMLHKILIREDDEVSKAVTDQFKKEEITLCLGSKVKGFDADDVLQWAEVEDDSGHVKNIVFDVVLVAVGRKANTDNLGLNTLGIETTKTGTIKVNDYLQTCYPNIYACGDVAGPYQFTHTASHQAWYTSVNALFGAIKKFKVDYSVIPWCTFTDPEVAHVGLSEKEAVEKGISYEVTRYDIGDLDRAIADGEAKGFIKVLTPPDKDKILGATIVGYHAGELITEFVLAMKHGLGLNKILGTIHIYPTFTESNKYLAGEWKKAHAPAKVLRMLKKWHSWVRR